MGQEFGIDGYSPEDRANQLKQLSVEGIAIMLEEINKRVQGSAESLVSNESIVKVGGIDTIPIDARVA